VDLDVDSMRAALVDAAATIIRCLAVIETAALGGADATVDAILDAEVAPNIDVEDFLHLARHQIGALEG